MKIACSSASFSRAFATGTLTQLEWLDVCANELEVDGAVFDARDFPREDADYLAQVKKTATDLGLTVAALDVGSPNMRNVDHLLTNAATLGAPLLMVRAPERSDDPQAWGAFADEIKAASGAAKRSNVTLALRAAGGTLCESVADCKRLAKDVDSAWLRLAFTPLAFTASDDPAVLLSKAVIAIHTVARTETFARPDDPQAHELINALARFRGFTVIEHPVDGAADAAFHATLERFASLRAQALVRTSP